MSVYQWRVSFNPHILNQSQDIIFTKKSKKLAHSSVLLNNVPVQNSTTQKNLGVYLEEKVNFYTNFIEKLRKASEGI